MDVVATEIDVLTADLWIIVLTGTYEYDDFKLCRRAGFMRAFMQPISQLICTEHETARAFHDTVTCSLKH